MDKFILDAMWQIADSYKAVRVVWSCENCRGETVHLKATCVMPITGDTCLTLECQTCFTARTQIIPIEDLDEN